MDQKREIERERWWWRVTLLNGNILGVSFVCFDFSCILELQLQERRCLDLKYNIKLKWRKKERKIWPGHCWCPWKSWPVFGSNNFSIKLTCNESFYNFSYLGISLLWVEIDSPDVFLYCSGSSQISLIVLSIYSVSVWTYGRPSSSPPPTTTAVQNEETAWTGMMELSVESRFDLNNNGRTDTEKRISTTIPPPSSGRKAEVKVNTQIIYLSIILYIY